MKKYIYIAAGGMLGAMSRFGIENIQLWDFQKNFPVNTLFVNLTGSFFLMFFLTIAFEALELDADIRLGIATGFLGAFTTFSTLCIETVSLMTTGEYFTAITYIVISAVLGLAIAYLGVISARKIIGKLIGENPEASLDDNTNNGGNITDSRINDGEVE
jgi:CrcB protein